MVYGGSINFSSVILPGAGGQINPSNAISSEMLAKLNKSGKKWRVDEDGNLAYHREQMLERNAKVRQLRENLINRGYSNNADGADAMAEIMGRKRARAEAFRQIKQKEYSFADDTELMAIPQPFASAEGCQKCGKTCDCPSCRNDRSKDIKFKEWTAKQRAALQSGNVRGDFAGPGMSFPIASPEDVSAAWASVGRASNPRKTMANIIKIARRFGWESGLPKSVIERLKAGKSGLPE